MDGKNFRRGTEPANVLANRGTRRIQFLEVFEIASPQVHQLEDKNIFIDSKNPTEKTYKDKKKTRHFGKKNHEAGLEKFIIPSKTTFKKE